MLGLGLAVAVAMASRHPRTLVGLAVLSIVAGLLLLAAAGVYTLDALQMQGAVPEESREAFRIGTGKALFKNVFAAAVLLWIGRVAWQDRRAGGSAREGASGRAESAPLVTSGS